MLFSISSLYFVMSSLWVIIVLSILKYPSRGGAALIVFPTPPTILTPLNSLLLSKIISSPALKGAATV